jgi:hypothetical protein
MRTIIDETISAIASWADKNPNLDQLTSIRNHPGGENTCTVNLVYKKDGIATREITLEINCSDTTKPWNMAIRYSETYDGVKEGNSYSAYPFFSSSETATYDDLRTVFNERIHRTLDACVTILDINRENQIKRLTNEQTNTDRTE